MNIKRTILILVALMIVFISISAVSAGLFDGLFGNSQNNITNISGLQFNIPDGYVVDNTSMNRGPVVTWFNKDLPSGLVAELLTDDYSKILEGSEVSNTTERTYTNGNDTINITIQHPFNGTKYSANINSNKTINGFAGEFKENPKECLFKYYDGDTFIIIAAPDESLISNIIVGK